MDLTGNQGDNRKDAKPTVYVVWSRRTSSRLHSWERLAHSADFPDPEPAKNWTDSDPKALAARLRAAMVGLPWDREYRIRRVGE